MVHKSDGPCYHVFLMEAGVMTFVVPCTVQLLHPHASKSSFPYLRARGLRGRLQGCHEANPVRMRPYIGQIEWAAGSSRRLLRFSVIKVLLPIHQERPFILQASSPTTSSSPALGRPRDSQHPQRCLLSFNRYHVHVMCLALP